MTNEASKGLQTFIKKARWEYKFPLTNDVRLYEDLGIYGDDVEDFFIAFGKEFNVNVSGFMAADYFKDEGFDFFKLLVDLFEKQEIQPVRKKILTLGHLDKAIKAGRLDDEIINS